MTTPTPKGWAMRLLPVLLLCCLAKPAAAQECG